MLSSKQWNHNFIKNKETFWSLNKIEKIGLIINVNYIDIKPKF